MGVVSRREREGFEREVWSGGGSDEVGRCRLYLCIFIYIYICDRLAFLFWIYIPYRLSSRYCSPPHTIAPLPTYSLFVHPTSLYTTFQIYPVGPTKIISHLRRSSQTRTLEKRFFFTLFASAALSSHRLSTVTAIPRKYRRIMIYYKHHFVRFRSSTTTMSICHNPVAAFCPLPPISYYFYVYIHYTL